MRSRPHSTINLSRKINPSQKPDPNIQVMQQNMKRNDKVQQKMRTFYSSQPKQIKKFKIEDLYTDNTITTAIKMEDSQRFLMKEKIIQNQQNSQMPQTQKDFYYIDNNEIQSVREFMYRLDSMLAQKKFESKLSDINKKREKISDVQSRLYQKSIQAAQMQCFQALKKKLISEGIQMEDNELMEMIRKLKFKSVKDLKMTNREADRQIISFILSGNYQEKKYNKVQRVIDKAYSQISNPVYFDLYYNRFLKAQEKNAQNTNIPQNTNFPQPQHIQSYSQITKMPHLKNLQSLQEETQQRYQ